MAHMTPHQGGRTHTPAPSALPAAFLLLRATVLPVFPLENQGPRRVVCVHSCIPSAAHSDVCVMDEGPGISWACSVMGHAPAHREDQDTVPASAELSQAEKRDLTVQCGQCGDRGK